MGKKFTYTLLFIMVTFASRAEGYRIFVNWEGMADSSIFLAHYFDTNIYVNDTIQLNSKAEGIFEGKEPLQQGLYVLYQSGSNFIDFLLGADQVFSISTKQSDIYGSLVIKGAAESEEFIGYQKTLKEKAEKKKALNDSLKNQDKDQQEITIDKLNQIDKEMENYMESEIKKSDSSMYGVFLRTANQLVVPDPPFEKTTPAYDSLAWFYAYNYRRDHFLDGLNFTDERMLYTPVFKTKLDTYFNRILIQSPDSIIRQAKKLIHESEPNPRMFQYITQYLLNFGIQSKIMGMDAVFVAVADEVYLKGKATWANDSIVKKIAEEAYLTRPNLIGKKAPDFTMENIEGEYESLYLSHGEYTIIVFYEHDCGHCKKEVPELYNNVYMKFLDHNIEVYAVCMDHDDDKTKWTEFVDKNSLEGWHHLWDPKNQSLYQYNYNVKTTPTVYLLDKDKKIIAKKLDNENLSKLLGVLLKEK